MRTLTLLGALLITGMVQAQVEHQFDYQAVEPVAFSTLAEAAQWADLVAIAQVDDIDYIQTRNLNAMGQTYLHIRVPYKGTKKDELIIVNAKGFDDWVCYYPDRVNEGERFLVFLKATKNQYEYVGFKPFCQLQVLLTDTGEYALRYPLDADIELPDELVSTLQFNDPHAEIDATEWTSIRRDEHVQRFSATVREDSDYFHKYFYLQYTRGMLIYHLRKLLQLSPQPRISSEQM